MNFICYFISSKFYTWSIHSFSAPDEEVYNYYNNKRNILNQWFVKRLGLDNFGDYFILFQYHL